MEDFFAEGRENSESSQSGAAAMLHDHTYGITSDPLTQFACVFSALIRKYTDAFAVILGFWRLKLTCKSFR